MRIIFTMLIVTGTLFFAGCGESKTPTATSAADRFNEIKTGMTVAEVENILGPADVTTEGLTDETRYWDPRGENSIAIVFVDGKVTAKERANQD